MPTPVTVRCHAGYRGDEYPVAVRLGQRWLRVTGNPRAETVQRVDGGCRRRFFVRLETGRRLILEHDEQADTWLRE